LTGAYYKDGGRPWQLADVRPGVCYVGLAYKRQDDSTDDRFACCAAQMFLSSGEGVVFRGALGPWFHSESKQFHLSEEAARNLVEMVIGEYRQMQDGLAPKELFIHAKSSFADPEWQGFEKAAPGTNVVGVQISDAKDRMKLFRRSVSGHSRYGAYPKRAAGVSLDVGVRPKARHLSRAGNTQSDRDQNSAGGLRPRDCPRRRHGSHENQLQLLSAQ